jgi:HAD superfamily hydrolase (TIGR01549 family)
MTRAVIFDLGHTLWDIGPDTNGALEQAYASVHATLCERLGRGDVPPATAIKDAITKALFEDLPGPGYGEPLEQPPTHTWVGRGCRSVGLELDEALLREITLPLFATELDRLIVGEDTVGAVERLRARGVRLGCVTNTLTDQATIQAMLDRYGFGELMETVVVSAEEGYRKPHASLFDKAMRELGVEPAEATFVGDSPYHDIGGAKAVGMRGVLTRQYVTRPWIEGVPAPDATIDHVRELVALLDDAAVVSEARHG